MLWRQSVLTSYWQHFGLIVFCKHGLNLASFSIHLWHFQITNNVKKWDYNRPRGYISLNCLLQIVHPRPLFRLSPSFPTKVTIFYTKCTRKNVHPVYDAGIWTHHHQNLLPKRPDQRYRFTSILFTASIPALLNCFTSILFTAIHGTRKSYKLCFKYLSDRGGKDSMTRLVDFLKLMAAN